jgi:polysaccharide export outer membrane protein
MAFPNNTLKIFLVDDDAFSLKLTEQNIQQLGYTDISRFFDGRDCLNQLNQKPDVIFLDHDMKNITGLDVLKRIKLLYNHIHVVMLSGQREITTAITALKSGAFDYLIKGDDEEARIADVLKRIARLKELSETPQDARFNNSALFN